MSGSKDDNTLYYRYEPSGQYLPRTRKVKGANGQQQEQQYLEPELTKVYFSEQQVNNFNLDRFGMPVHALVNGQTVIPNYILDYWGCILGDSAAYLLILLMRHDFERDEHGETKRKVWPSMKTLEELTGKDERALKRHIEILENHHFIYRFWRADKNKGSNKSTYFILRKTIPYLSEEQVNQLSPERQKKHDDFLRLIAGHINSEIELPKNYDYSDEMKKIIDSGFKSAPRKLTPYEMEQYNSIRREKVTSEITEDDKRIWEDISKSLSKKISPPSIETWFKSSFCKVTEQHMTVYAANPFARDWIESRYNQLIREMYYETQFEHLSDLTIDTITINIPYRTEE